MANIGTPILGLPTTVGGLSGSEWIPVVQGGTTKRTQASNLNFLSTVFPAGIDYVMFGGSGNIPTGVLGTGLIVPFNCTINQAVMNGNTTASMVVDIWKCTESQFDGGATHPVVGDSITGGNPPTITAGSKYSDSVLSGWTLSLTQGDVLWYNVVSNTGFTSATLALKVSRSLP